MCLEIWARTETSADYADLYAEGPSQHWVNDFTATQIMINVAMETLVQFFGVWKCQREGTWKHGGEGVYKFTIQKKEKLHGNKL